MNRFPAGLKSSSPLLKQEAPTQLRVENREHFILPAQPLIFSVFWTSGSFSVVFLTVDRDDARDDSSRKSRQD
jgi:hypothetical protein